MTPTHSSSDRAEKKVKSFRVMSVFQQPSRTPGSGHARHGWWSLFYIGGDSGQRPGTGQCLKSQRLSINHDFAVRPVSLPATGKMTVRVPIRNPGKKTDGHNIAEFALHREEE